MKLLRNQIIIRPDTERKTESGIFLPDTMKDRFNEGEVVALGEYGYRYGEEVVGHNVKVGDRVLYRSNTGEDFPYEGETCYLTSEDGVIGILEPAREAVAV
ncbi:MAG: co-chaperone GroES [Cyanobacteria bacterium REEB65]|nr:co-chaperone GroES [Cyanobacteria bacterium REEB65]